MSCNNFTKSDERSLRVLFGCLFALVFGPCILAGGVYEIYWGYQSQSWTPTSGIVRSFKLEDAFADSDSSNNFLGIIEYEYIVDGHTYLHEVLGGVSTCESERLQNRYEPGSRIDVYYDPTKHSRSSLKTGVNLSSSIWLIFGLLFIVLGLAIARKRN